MPPISPLLCLVVGAARSVIFSPRPDSAHQPLVAQRSRLGPMETAEEDRRLTFAEGELEPEEPEEETQLVVLDPEHVRNGQSLRQPCCGNKDGKADKVTH